MHAVFVQPSRSFNPLGLVSVQRRDQLLDASYLEESLLVLVVGPAGIGAPALGGLAVTEIQRELLLRGTASS
jgi:hypothetical protein